MPLRLFVMATTYPRAQEYAGREDLYRTIIWTPPWHGIHGYRLNAQTDEVHVLPGVDRLPEWPEIAYTLTLGDKGLANIIHFIRDDLPDWGSVDAVDAWLRT